MAIGKKTLERLQVELTADDSKLKGALGKASDSVSRFGDGLQKLKAVALPVAGAVAGIGGAALGAAVKAGRMADTLLDLSDQTGLSTDALQEYRRVTNFAGVEMDAVARAAEQMTLRFSRGAEGSADLRQGLSQLGISAKDAEGNIRPMGEIVDEAITGLAGMANETERNILATKLFSRGANELAPILGMGADEIARLREEAHEMGIVIGEDGLESANNFRQSYDSLQQTLGNVADEIGVRLAPTFTTLAATIESDWIPVIRSVTDAFAFVIEGAALLPASFKLIWLDVQAVFVQAVDAIGGTLGRLGEKIPFIGEKIGHLREQVQGWADTELTALTEKMDEVALGTVRATDAIRDQTGAIGEHAAAAASGAGVVAKAAGFEQVALLDLQNTIQGLAIAHQELEAVAVGTSQSIQIKAGSAFQQMADRVQISANQVLGAVTQVLNKLTGGGGIFGAISGAIGGFLSGGPIGGALGFIGGLAEGGTIRPGQSAIVGEAGPELITPGVTTTVTPMSQPSPSVADALLRALERPPQPITPDGLAVDTFWRQAFSALVQDGKARGVL